jgi:hypothetical protein
LYHGQLGLVQEIKTFRSNPFWRIFLKEHNCLMTRQKSVEIQLLENISLSSFNWKIASHWFHNQRIIFALILSVSVKLFLSHHWKDNKKFEWSMWFLFSSELSFYILPKYNSFDVSNWKYPMKFMVWN